MSKYHKKVYSLAYRLTGSREDAMDVTQEVFLRVFRALPTFQDDKPFLPWVYRIAWNLCADRGRKQVRSGKEDSLENIESLVGSLPSGDPEPDEQFERAEIGRIVSEAVKKLPEGYRELVVLFHLEGFSIRDISELTGLKETVIKNRLYRGRQMLKAILEAGGFSLD